MINEYYTISTIVFLVILWIITVIYYSKRYDKFISALLKSMDNIIIISNKNKIVNMNKKGLSFFGFSSISDFNSSPVSLASFFIEEEGCFGKHTDGQKWLDKLATSKKKETIKIKLFNQEDKEYSYFHLKVSKIDFSREYLLLFHNITEMEGEKKRIVRRAERDALTGIYNRVKLNELFPTLFYNANRYDQNFSIILFDIDHFKRINDTYGHNIGDSVLVELTHTVKNLLREEDIFVRWGGEEFIIILPIVSLPNAFTLASRLRKNIEEHPFLHVGEVTCSFGVTNFTAGDTQMILFERVDEALYAAKSDGRNRVVMTKP